MPLAESVRDGKLPAERALLTLYAYYLPTYSQQDWFAGSGWMPGRSTLLNILSSAAYVLEPLYQHYGDYDRTAPVISPTKRR